MAAALEAWCLVECLTNRSVWIVLLSCCSTRVGLGDCANMSLSHPDAWLLFRDCYNYLHLSDGITDTPQWCRVLSVTDCPGAAYDKFHWALTNALHGDGYYGATTDDDEEWLLMECFHKLSGHTYNLLPPRFSRDAKVGIQMPSPASPARFYDDIDD